MYSDKEVAALIKLYNNQGKDLTPEKFLESVNKEDGWNYSEKLPAVFKADEDMDHDSYLVKLEMMMPISTENIGEHAGVEEIVEEFKKGNPWLSDLIGENGEKLFIFKAGDLTNKAYTGGKVKEKAPKLKEPSFKEANETYRHEIIVKKLKFDDDTWHALTYDITSGTLDEKFNIEECLGTLLSAVISIIRSSDDEVGHMKETMNFLNALFIDPTAGAIHLGTEDFEDGQNPLNQKKK